MKHIFAVQNQRELLAYQSFLEKHRGKLEQYLTFLKDRYAVTQLPRAVVWADLETATFLISDLPIPAYTNEYRTVFCPEIPIWKSVYLRQLEQFSNAEIREYYEKELSVNHILQILGHEFVHHSDLFLDDFDGLPDSGIWFEEGMCEYISRKYFLTDSEFNRQAQINALLVENFRQRYEAPSLEEFGMATYQEDYAAIFFQYWRSFLAVLEIVERFGGDVQAVFRSYHRWDRCGRVKTLEEWFAVR